MAGMFGSLTEKLSEAFKHFKNKGKLTEKDVRDGMRAVKMALLSADVNFLVVKDFINRVTERAVGAEVLESLVPAQQVIKIVNEELTAIMGSTEAKLKIAPKPPTVIMMVGLQGAGKTTHCGKLAALLKKQGKTPLLAACDVYRPAAIKQLQIVGEQAQVPVYTEENAKDPVKIAKNALDYAKKQLCDVVIIDTAGRLQIDEAMMEELQRIKKETDPTEILLVVDAMTGQSAVDVAKTFNEMIDITGVVMTKLDGDTRGGAALSVRHITGKPIKFVGTGEKLDKLEVFHPDRMASRILGMGDVLTLIEKTQENFDAKKAAELEEKIRKSRFTLVDYLETMAQMRSAGGLESMLSMMPGMNTGSMKDAKIDEKLLDRQAAIILSMTLREREKPEIINSSRKRRIAQGSGTTVEDVNKLLRQFEQMNKMMKQFSGGKMKNFGRFGKFPF
ncbi:MAG: signal recognition particle protein [Clostridia bacterium]|nr:signal recognition particle protein [Clostridia bacterium]